MGKSNELKCKN